MSRMVFAFTSWNVQAWMRASICFSGRAATAAGVRAAANSRRDTGSVVSSRVRMLMMHATRISNTDVCPSPNSSKRAAFGYGAVTSRRSGTAASMSNGFLAALAVGLRGFFFASLIVAPRWGVGTSARGRVQLAGRRVAALPPAGMLAPA